MRSSAHTKIRGGKEYHQATLILDSGTYVISGFASLLEAQSEAERLLNDIKEGKTTIEEIKNRNKITIDGETKTTKDWASFLGISRARLYKSAKNSQRSLAEEIQKRLASK